MLNKTFFYFFALYSFVPFLRLDANPPFNEPFDPGLFDTYIVNDIGTSSSPLQGLGIELTGVGGNSYLNSAMYSVPSSSQVGNQPYQYYINGNAVNNIEAQSNSLGIQVGGNITLNSSELGNSSNIISGGGNLLGSGSTINGNVTLAGSNLSSNTINGTLKTGQPFTPLLNYAGVNQYFTAASNYWKSLPTNITPTVQNGNTLLFNLAGTNNQYIYNTTLSQLNSFAVNTANTGTGSYLIINITDVASNATLTLTNPTIGSHEQTIFNTPGIQNLTVDISAPGTSSGAIGGFLSPNTNLTINGSFNNPKDLSIVASSVLIAESLNGNSFILDNRDASGNFNPFPGFLAQENNFLTPEPSTFILLGSLLAGTVFLHRKRKAVLHS